MSKSAWFVLAVALASCSSTDPTPKYTSLSSAASNDPDKQGAELALQGVVRRGDTFHVAKTIDSKNEFETHTVEVDPKVTGSTFQLVRYFLAPEDWILTKLTYEKGGKRTYIFRRIIEKGPKVEMDPFKPRVGQPGE